MRPPSGDTLLRLASLALAVVLWVIIAGRDTAERGLEVWEKDASDEAWAEAEAAWDAMAEGEMRPV